MRQVALIAALTQGRDLLVRRQGRQVEDARDDLFGGETQSDFFVLMRAWRYADRNGYNLERCRRLGIHAQSARQVGPLFEQFLGHREARRIGRQRKACGRRMRSSGAYCSGFPIMWRAASMRERCDANWCTVGAGVLARESVVQNSPLLVVTEVHEIQSGTGKDKELNVLLSMATAIQTGMAAGTFPGRFHGRHKRWCMTRRSDGCLRSGERNFAIWCWRQDAWRTFHWMMPRGFWPTRCWRVDAS